MRMEMKIETGNENRNGKWKLEGGYDFGLVWA